MHLIQRREWLYKRGRNKGIKRASIVTVGATHSFTAVTISGKRNRETIRGTISELIVLFFLTATTAAGIEKDRREEADEVRGKNKREKVEK